MPSRAPLPRLNRPEDHFRDLRDDGIAERGKAVHPSGNPMSHSTHVGFNCPPAGITPIAGSVNWPRRGE